eukprot:4525792-Amphidinium_carterae.1
MELMVLPKLVSPHLKYLITFAGPQHQSLGNGFCDYVSGQVPPLIGRISPVTGQIFTGTGKILPVNLSAEKTIGQF